ncbi:MAG: hypothetical protein NTY38_09575, partial [Acidobacteria bacterium]|nr:hypothetical protein [Acidobacteriota bacterium]
EGDSDQAILVSIDYPGRSGIIGPLRERLRLKLPGFDVTKLVINATHTHTAPETIEGIYRLPKEGVMPIPEYREFLLRSLVDVAVRAWQARQPGGVSWGLGHAVIGYNRRAVYSDGSSRMYGPVSNPEFTHIEGYEDHAVQTLFFWTPEKKLTGMGVLVPCPAQEVESASFISADFWADVRTALRSRYGQDIFIYPMTGASGDQSPHLLVRQRAEDKARARRGLSRTQEIARRIANAVAESFEGAERDIRTEPVFAHRTKLVPLPLLRISEADAEAARKEHERLLGLPESDKRVQFQIYQQKDVLDRYEQQKRGRDFRAETHVIRLADIAIATNPFELYLDYGIRMEGRSPAEQTFVVQLAGDYGGYLATKRAMEGGGYGAKLSGNSIGPEGGQMFVERSIEILESLWKETTP